MSPCFSGFCGSWHPVLYHYHFFLSCHLHHLSCSIKLYEYNLFFCFSCSSTFHTGRTTYSPVAWLISHSSFYFKSLTAPPSLQVLFILFFTLLIQFALVVTGYKKYYCHKKTYGGDFRKNVLLFISFFCFLFLLHYSLIWGHDVRDFDNRHIDKGTTGSRKVWQHKTKLSPWSLNRKMSQRWTNHTFVFECWCCVQGSQGQKHEESKIPDLTWVAFPC